MRVVRSSFTRAQSLVLDALVPPSLHLVLPNLRSVTQRYCTLSAAAATTQLDSECSGLQHLEVYKLVVDGEAALPAQLAQLSSLRGLTSLSLCNNSLVMQVAHTQPHGVVPAQPQQPAHGPGAQPQLPRRCL